VREFSRLWTKRQLIQSRTRVTGPELNRWFGDME
jgi:hypothetical protein